MGTHSLPRRQRRPQTWQHFVCFVQYDGALWELDGRKSEPIMHGPSSPESLLHDAVAVIKGFMSRDPDELRFT